MWCRQCEQFIFNEVDVLGNKDTLLTIPTQRSQDIRDELLKFHERYYSSNVMALTVLGKGPCSCYAVTCSVSCPLCISYNRYFSWPFITSANQTFFLSLLRYFACLSVSVIDKKLWMNFEIWRRLGWHNKQSVTVGSGIDLNRGIFVIFMWQKIQQHGAIARLILHTVT